MRGGVIGDGGGGRTEGTGSPERCYPVVLVNGFDRSLCLGLIGRTGNRNASFCVRKDCKVKSHNIKKFGGLGDNEAAFFIARVSEATVYSQPSVKEAQVPKETQAEWQDQMWSLATWVRAFAAVTINDDGMASNEDIKMEIKFLAESEVFKTPTKKRKSEVVSIVGHQKLLPEDGSPELELMIADGSLAKGGLTRIVSQIESSVVDMGKALEEIVVLTQGRFGANEENIRHMAGAMQNLIATLGPVVEMDDRFEAPTLWGTASFIGEEVLRLEADTNAAKARTNALESDVKGAFFEIQQSEVSKSTAHDKMLKILSLMMSRVQAINPELERVKMQIQKLVIEGANQNQPKKQKRDATPGWGGGGRSDDTMDNLMSLLSTKADVNETSVPSKDKHEAMEGLVSEHVGGGGLRELEDEIERMSNDVRLLIVDVGALKACAEDESIKFSGLGFRNIQECNMWIEENFQGMRYGLMMDPLLMLDRIFGQDEVESQFKTFESRVKLNIPTGAEASAIKALNYSRPRLFHSGKVAMTNERNSSKLSKLTTYSIWKSGSDGVRNYITKMMNQIQLTVSHEIAYAFGRMPRAMAIATASLNATVTFLTQLLQFIDTIYEKLHSDSKFSAEQAWSLATQILDRVCEDLFAPKEGVTAAMVVNEPNSICSHLLWACFRTHDVMAAYVEQNFENHPAISAEYVKFLATNSGSERVEKLEALVKSMKETVTKVTDAGEKAKTKAELATDKVSALNKEMESLKKRVLSLESGKGSK